MIIWGWRAIRKTLGRGNFLCPKEGAERTYVHKSARRWFTLFFIPVIPLKELGTYVECNGCRATYNEAVLQLPSPASVDRTLTVGLRSVVALVLGGQSMSPVSQSQRDAAVALLRDRVEVDGYDHATLEHDLSISSTDLNRAIHDFGAMLQADGREQILRALIEIVFAGQTNGRDQMDLIAHVGTAMGMSAAHAQGVIDDALQTRRLSEHSPAGLPRT